MTCQHRNGIPLGARFDSVCYQQKRPESNGGQVRETEKCGISRVWQRVGIESR